MVSIYSSTTKSGSTKSGSTKSGNTKSNSTKNREKNRENGSTKSSTKNKDTKSTEGVVCKEANTTNTTAAPDQKTDSRKTFFRCRKKQNYSVFREQQA